MPKLRAPDGKSSSESTPPWSAETSCNTCGEYKPCRCADERNICRTLVFLAAWKSCASCGARVLYVDECARTNSDFICGRCDKRREAMGAQARRIDWPSLPRRAAMRLRSLFSTANDNAAVASFMGVQHAS
jgi:hypothetical protein